MNRDVYHIVRITSYQYYKADTGRDYYLATQMYKCVHGFATKLLCDMIVMALDVNVRNTRNTDSLSVYMPKPNIECYRKSFKYAGGKIWNDLLIIYRMHHQWRHLNMPIRNLILNTGTLTDRSNFFYICHIICIVYIVYNHTGAN